MINRLRSKPVRILGLLLGWTAIVVGALSGGFGMVGFWLFSAAWSVVTALVIAGRWGPRT
jgi:hypothetical protein